jgi:hypothetical protein
MPLARDLRRRSQVIALHAPREGRPRVRRRTSADVADAASSRAGAEPAGKPAVPVRRLACLIDPRGLTYRHDLRR